MKAYVYINNLGFTKYTKKMLQNFQDESQAFYQLYTIEASFLNFNNLETSKTQVLIQYEIWVVLLTDLMQVGILVSVCFQHSALIMRTHSLICSSTSLCCYH